MKSTGVLFGLFLITSTVTAQGFLTDYFNGNMDSLIVGATQLIHFPEPTFQSDGNPAPPDPQSLVEVGLEQVYNAEYHYFTARDNKQIFAYFFPNPSPDTIVLLHGVASSAYLSNRTAVLLRESTGAEVYAIDLRGHGRAEGDISAEGIRIIVAAYSSAEIGIIEGATHNGVRHNETSFILINKWFLTL